MLSSPESAALQRLDLWRHSLATAVAAETIARHTTRQPADVVFTSGLLHDIGKVVLARAATRQYATLLEQCREQSLPVYEAESEMFRIDHARAGAQLLQRWKFPDALVAAIRSHHQPEILLGPNSQLAALLYLGNAVAYRIVQSAEIPTYAGNPNPLALQMLDLEPERLASLEEEIQERFQREQERF